MKNHILTEIPATKSY